MDNRGGARTGVLGRTSRPSMMNRNIRRPNPQNPGNTVTRPNFGGNPYMNRGPELRRPMPNRTRRDNTRFNSPAVSFNRPKKPTY